MIQPPKSMGSRCVRFFICFGVAAMVITAWCTLIVATANNFLAEGPDTPLSRAIADPLLRLANAVGSPSLATLCFALALPILLTTAAFFGILEAILHFWGSRASTRNYS